MTWTLVEMPTQIPTWTVTQGGQRHELAQVVIERGDARSVWRVERTVSGVKTMEVV